MFRHTKNRFGWFCILFVAILTNIAWGESWFYVKWNGYSFHVRKENNELSLCQLAEISKVWLPCCNPAPSGDFVIPSKLDIVENGETNSYPVTSIGIDAFSMEDINAVDQTLVSVTIPSSVTSIEAGAFAKCKTMERISIPNSITNIGARAFNSCTNLRGSISIPYGQDTIYYNTFYDCKRLEGVTIPNTVCKIEDSAFEGCISLSKIQIPSSVTHIGGGAFSGCVGLDWNEEIFFPNLKVLGFGAFHNCLGIKRVTIPANGLTLQGIFGDSYANITSVVFTAGTGVIGEEACSGCSSISNLVIESGVKKIELLAFVSCTGLKSVILPDTVTDIADRTFVNCSSLREFRATGKIYDILGETFSGCTSLSEVHLPDSVTNIGWRAFQHCESLHEFNFPANLKWIKDEAFCCAGLEKVVLPSSVACIGDLSFYQAYDQTYTLKDFVVNNIRGIKICSHAISGYVTNAVFGTGYVTFDGLAFYNNNVLKSIVFNSDYAPTIQGSDPDDGKIYLSNFFKHVTKDCVVYVKAGSKGWNGGNSDTLPETWGGLRITYSPITLSFDVNGGNESYSSRTLTPRDDLGTLPTPTKDGCTFIGWFTEREGGTFVASTGVVTDESVTLYAHWLDGAIDYVVRDGTATIGNGESCASDPAPIGDYIVPEILGGYRVTAIAASAFANCDALTSVTLPSVAMGSDVFSGATSLAKVIFYGDAPTNVSEDFLDGAPEDAVVLVLFGTKGWNGNWKSKSLPESGYWPNSESGRRIEFISVPVTLNACGGTIDPSVLNLTALDSYGTLPIPIRANHTFIGWFTDAVGGELVTPERVVPNAPVTLYAHWDSHVWKYSVVDDGVIVFGITPKTGDDVAVPDRIDGLPVTQIAPSTFSGSGFKSIEIPNGVTTIGASAFYGCIALSNVVVGKCCTNIGDYAFRNCSRLRLVTFAGNAPTCIGTGIYMNTMPYLVSFVDINSTGWNGSVGAYEFPDTWPVGDDNARSLVRFGEYIEPLPVLYSTNQEAIVCALTNSADVRLFQNISNIVQYNNYRIWAESVKMPDGSATANKYMVRDSPNAWLSFALMTDKLIDHSPVSDELKVKDFAPSSTDGAFDFTVEIDDVFIGTEADKANLKKVFGIEGGASLDEMSSDDIDISFNTPEDGKVKFTATPKDTSSTSFFMRVKMNEN